jgi:hypothetical protein
MSINKVFETQACPLIPTVEIKLSSSDRNLQNLKYVLSGPLQRKSLLTELCRRVGEGSLSLILIAQVNFMQCQRIFLLLNQFFTFRQLSKILQN